jgi:hypothetical protein
LLKPASFFLFSSSIFPPIYHKGTGSIFPENDPAGSMKRRELCPGGIAGLLLLNLKPEHMETLQDGFVPMRQNELAETHGGCPAILVPILIAAASAAIAEIISDWDNFKAGLMGKPEIKD